MKQSIPRQISLKLLGIVFVFCFFCGCVKNIEKTHKNSTQDFEVLMGKDLPAWKHVQTAEDFANLSFFKTIYEKNIKLLTQQQEEIKIPKIIHFIWLGSKPFPRESIENIRSWIAHHPDWKIKFWTDRQRPLPHPGMEMHLVKDFSFEKLKPFYLISDNYGEKSDLLRYEILFKEGGIYVDHDVKCIKSFEDFHFTYNFYCGMEIPYPTSLSSSIWPTNNIVASTPKHVILEKIMDWLEKRWDQIEEDYPGKDRDSIIQRVSHRTFLVLGEIFKAFGNTLGNIDIAFPSYYFNSPHEEWALYSQHKYAGSWFENESKFEKNVRKRLMMLCKKANKLLLSAGILMGFNMMGFAVLIVLFFRLRKQRSN